MKNTLLLLLFFSAQIAFTQEYSYVSDRIFTDTESFFGYDFKPAFVEIPDVSQSEIDPGEYSFGITSRNLYAEGEGVRGVYSMNNIAPTEYGYKITTMSTRDARIQGHLKIIMNKRNQVTAMIFRRSKEDPEIIFTLPEADEDRIATETEYFTDLREMKVENADSIWGTKIFPFLRIYLDAGIQQRLQDYDSTCLHFEEVVTIEEKVKKSKKKKKEDDEAEVSASEEEDDTEVKVKVTKTYYLNVQMLTRYDDGSEKIERQRYEISNVKEREDETAQGDEERYQIEFANKKDIPIYLYLNADRMVSSMEIGDRLYLMRGF